MIIPSRPADDERRLEVVRGYKLLDTLPEQALDDLTALAAHICGAPISLISLVDERRQWFKSKLGWAAGETDRDISFCAHAINQRELFIVPDATKDPRFADNPLVTGEPQIQFYAGAPLITAEGHALGTLCVIDRVPRELTSVQEEALRVLSRQVMAQLELRRQTGILKESEAKFSAAFHSTSVAFGISSMDGKLVEVNPAYCALTGYSRAEMIGKTMVELGLLSPAERERVRAEITRNGGRLRDEELTIKARDGSVRQVLYSTEEIVLNGVMHRVGTGMNITERKQAQAAHRESTENLRKIIDGLSPNIFLGLMTSDGTLVEANRSALVDSGLRPEDILGRRFDETHWWSHSEAARERLRAAMARAVAGEPSRYDEQIRLKGDTLVWIDFSLHPVIDGSGRVSYLVPSAIVVDERVRAEAARRESLQRFEIISRATNDAVWDWDLSTNALSWNRNIESLFGYRAEGIEAGIESWTNRVHPEDKEHVLSGIHAAIEGGQQLWSHEYRFRRGDGSYADVLDRGYVLRDVSGRGIRMIGAMQDISARKQAEQRLVRLNRTHAVLTNLNQLIVRERESHKILEGACRIAVERGGFLMAWVGLVDESNPTITVNGHAGAAPDTVELLERILEGDGCAFTKRVLSHGGHVISNDIARDPLVGSWREAALKRGFRAMVSLPLVVEGRRRGVFNLYADQAGFFDDEELRLLDDLAMDIAFALEGCERERARQTALEQLRASEERFRELAETINEVFWITDPLKTRVHFVSAAYERIWGRSCASLYASPGSWLESIHPADRARIRTALPTKQAEGRYDETYRILRADGTERWIHDRAFPVYGKQGEVLRIVGTAEDITNARGLEAQLRQSQKMDAIGQLAGGIAHDFNNILTAVVMQADLSGSSKGLSPDVAAGLKVIRACAERAANLTRQLLLFSHTQVMQPRNLNLNEVVKNLAAMLPRLIEEHVHLDLELHPTPLLTHADPGMVDQVIMNLAVNARDAMPDGGRLLIKTGEAIVNEEIARQHPDAAPGQYVCIRVTDTGTGIASDVLPRIFEPFFTTKSQGKGTGLGLATVFGIVQQHRGWIKVSSEPGRGTTFEIYFPAIEPVVVEVPLPVSAEPQSGTETILLVEDEPAVRYLTRVVLERSGYRVLEAVNGVEARRVWAQHAQEIDLLFTDMVMPGGLSGHELALALQAEKPELRVIFTSGYSVDLARGKLVLEEGYNFVQKPSTPQRLVETVRRCLDR